MVKKLLDNSYLWVKNFVGSKKFFHLILAVVVFQGLWYAFMYQPIIYDEGFHVKAIYFYVEHANPFNIGLQELKWDFLGDMSRNVSYVFYYLMSIPLRFIQIFTTDYTTQVIGMRSIMVGFFIAGLIMYKKAMELAGFSKFITNLAILFTVFLPYIAPLPGVINYDNVIFFLFAWGLYQSLVIVKSGKINFKDFALLIFITFSAMLTKFNTALALFTPILIYIVWSLYKNHKNKTLSLLIDSFKNSSKIMKYFFITILLMQTILIIERPVANYVIYHNQTPKCETILTKDRCMTNYTYKRNVVFREAKPESWRPIDIWSYFSTWWLTDMIKTSISMPGKSSMPLVKLIYYALGLSGIVLILINLKDLLKSKYIKMLIVGCLFFCTALFLENYRAYASLGQPVAMSGRYLLPYIPVFGALAVKSCADIFSDKIKKFMLSLTLLVILILITQGGGISTLILSQDTYWSNEISNNISLRAKSLLRPLIIENFP